MDRIGFIGLGAMGTPMAWNVHDSEYDLAVHNRTAAAMAPFAAEDVDTYDTPAHLAADVDAVVIMVTGPDALREVVTGEDGVCSALDPGRLVVNTSTVSRETTEDVAAAVAAEDCRFVDAPVLGTIGPAEAGELLVLAGGDDAAIDEATPLLDLFGDVERVGAVGDGTSMKLTTNLLLGVMMEGFSEALAFAEGQGLPLDQVLDVVQDGVLGAPLYHYKEPVVRDRDFQPQFPLDLLFKDLNLVLDAAGEDGTPLPAVGATREAASATRALGHGEEDMMALLKHLEAVTGRTVGDED